VSELSSYVKNTGPLMSRNGPVKPPAKDCSTDGEMTAVLGVGGEATEAAQASGLVTCTSCKEDLVFVELSLVCCKASVDGVLHSSCLNTTSSVGKRAKVMFFHSFANALQKHMLLQQLLATHQTSPH
jgi:hypothetical protein